MWSIIEVGSEFFPGFFDSGEFGWPDFIGFSNGYFVDSHLFLHVSSDGIFPLSVGFFRSFNWGSPFVNNLLFVRP